VREEAEMLKNVDLDWDAIHFPIRVLPVPARGYVIVSYLQVLISADR